MVFIRRYMSRIGQMRVELGGGGVTLWGQVKWPSLVRTFGRDRRAGENVRSGGEAPLEVGGKRHLVWSEGADIDRRKRLSETVRGGLPRVAMWCVVDERGEIRRSHRIAQ